MQPNKLLIATTAVFALGLCGPAMSATDADSVKDHGQVVSERMEEQHGEQTTGTTNSTRQQESGTDATHTSPYKKTYPDEENMHLDEQE